MAKKFKKPEKRFLTVETYARLSREAGFPLTAATVRHRIKKGLMEITNIAPIEGEFIDYEKYPFTKVKHRTGPKTKKEEVILEETEPITDLEDNI